MLLALFMLKHKVKQSKPPKSQVLGYIRVKKLVLLVESDLERVSGNQISWENDFAWRRNDLNETLEMSTPENGIWRITDAGEVRILEWITLLFHFAELRPDWESKLEGFRSIFGERVIISPSAVEIALEAYELAKAKFPDRIPLIPDNQKGKIRL